MKYILKYWNEILATFLVVFFLFYKIRKMYNARGPASDGTTEATRGSLDPDKKFLFFGTFFLIIGSFLTPAILLINRWCGHKIIPLSDPYSTLDMGSHLVLMFGIVLLIIIVTGAVILDLLSEKNGTSKLSGGFVRWLFTLASIYILLSQAVIVWENFSDNFVKMNKLEGKDLSHKQMLEKEIDHGYAVDSIKKVQAFERQKKADSAELGLTANPSPEENPVIVHIDTSIASKRFIDSVAEKNKVVPKKRPSNQKEQKKKKTEC